jgi:monovalent cation:H+ antiporter-2, CPA2 family
MLETIVLTLLLAILINLFLIRHDIPAIIGYIATGVAVTYLLNLSHATHAKELHLIAEFGIVFLMFTIGLEFSIHHLVRMRQEVFWYGSLQVGLSGALIAALSYYAGKIDLKSSIVIGAALALSSTAIVLKLLNSNRDINREYGKRALGILIFQDLMVIPILLMITIFSAEGVSTGVLLLKTLVDAVLLFVALWGFGKFVLEPFFNEVVKSNSDEIFVGSILFLVIGASALSHALGFSYSLGAFIAGMIIAETKYKHQVEADLIPFRDLLLGVFFVTVGMQIDFEVMCDYWWMILVLFGLLTLLKSAIIYLLVVRAAGRRVALKTALALFQLGEFGLVVFELAGSKNLVDPIVAQVLIATIILSMIATPFVLRHISLLADWVLRNDAPEETRFTVSEGLSDHAIVLGYGLLGRKICQKLEQRGVRYIAIEHNIYNVKEAQAQGKPVIFGNAAKRTILESVNIHASAVIIVAFDNTEKLYLECDIIRKVAPDAKVIVKVDKFREKRDLQVDFPEYEIIVGTEELARGMVESMLKCDVP